MLFHAKNRLLCVLLSIVLSLSNCAKKCAGTFGQSLEPGGNHSGNETLLTMIRKVLTESEDWLQELSLLLYRYCIRLLIVSRRCLPCTPCLAGCLGSSSLIGATCQTTLSSWTDNLMRSAAEMCDFVEHELAQTDFVESPRVCPFPVGTPVLLKRPARHKKSLPPYECGWTVINVVSPSTVVIQRLHPSGSYAEKIVIVEVLREDTSALLVLILLQLLRLLILPSLISTVRMMMMNISLLIWLLVLPHHMVVILRAIRGR